MIRWTTEAWMAIFFIKIGGSQCFGQRRPRRPKSLVVRGDVVPRYRRTGRMRSFGDRGLSRSKMGLRSGCASQTVLEIDPYEASLPCDGGQHRDARLGPVGGVCAEDAL